jgi:hypothetical protein
VLLFICWLVATIKHICLCRQQDTLLVSPNILPSSVPLPVPLFIALLLLLQAGSKKLEIKAHSLALLKPETRKWLHIDSYGQPLPPDTTEEDELVLEVWCCK